MVDVSEPLAVTRLAATPEGFSPAFEAYLRTLKPLFSDSEREAIDWNAVLAPTPTERLHSWMLGVLARMSRSVQFGRALFVRRRPSSSETRVP